MNRQMYESIVGVDGWMKLLQERVAVEKFACLRGHCSIERQR